MPPSGGIPPGCRSLSHPKRKWALVVLLDEWIVVCSPESENIGASRACTNGTAACETLNISFCHKNLSLLFLPLELPVSEQVCWQATSRTARARPCSASSQWATHMACAWPRARLPSAASSAPRSPQQCAGCGRSPCPPRSAVAWRVVTRGEPVSEQSILAARRLGNSAGARGCKCTSDKTRQTRQANPRSSPFYHDQSFESALSPLDTDRQTEW